MKKKHTIVLLLIIAGTLALGAALATTSAVAYPTYSQPCSNCHTAAPSGTVTAVPSTTTPAAGSAYTVAISIGLTAGGNTGYHIAEADSAGNITNWISVLGGPASQTTWTASMTAPATPGTYYYKVWTVKGLPFGSGMAKSVDYSIDVPAPVVQHTITASAGTGGSIGPSGAVTVADGADKTFTITAAGGYHVADVLVDGSSVGAQTSYTFLAVGADHTIAAGFAADPVVTGLVTVDVTDALGSPIAGAKIVLRGATRWTGLTDGAGIATFANVPYGSYSVTVSSRGYLRFSSSLLVDAASVEMTSKLSSRK